MRKFDETVEQLEAGMEHATAQEVAHAINNQLVTVLYLTNRITESLPPDHEAVEWAAHCETVVRRIATLTHDLAKSEPFQR